MTKREMLDRLKQTAGYSGDDGRFAFDAHRLDWLQFRAFLRDLTADVQAEETPRQSEDAYDNRPPADAKPDPRQPGPAPQPAPPPSPASITLIVPPYTPINVRWGDQSNKM